MRSNFKNYLKECNHIDASTELDAAIEDCEAYLKKKGWWNQSEHDKGVKQMIKDIKNGKG